MTEAINKANELINQRTNYIGVGENEGMDGYAVLTLIDTQGYPTSSTFTISKANGIKCVSLITDLSSNKANRVRQNNKASVHLASNNHNINLVGTVEIITAPSEKEKHWQPVYTKHYGPHTDPAYCVLKFTTERYSIFFSKEDLFEEGTL